MKKLFIVLGGLTAYATLLGMLLARMTTWWEIVGCIVAGFFAVAAGVCWLIPIPPSKRMR